MVLGTEPGKDQHGMESGAEPGTAGEVTGAGMAPGETIGPGEMAGEETGPGMVPGTVLGTVGEAIVPGVTGTVTVLSTGEMTGG